VSFIMLAGRAGPAPVPDTDRPDQPVANAFKVFLPDRFSSILTAIFSAVQRSSPHGPAGSSSAPRGTPHPTSTVVRSPLPNGAGLRDSVCWHQTAQVVPELTMEAIPRWQLVSSRNRQRRPAHLTALWGWTQDTVRILDHSTGAADLSPMSLFDRFVQVQLVHDPRARRHGFKYLPDQGPLAQTDHRSGPGLSRPRP
jgi:hypothetical protein